LQEIEQHLVADGMFALIDVFCHENEPRNDYLERWISHADQHYTSLQSEEKQLLFDHVMVRDYPISLLHWQKLGKQAGLEQFAVVLQDQIGLNALVTLARLPAEESPE
jgi:hypothetical protein